MDETGKPTARRVLAGAICLAVFAVVVFVALRGAPDEPAPTTAPVVEAEPVRMPRVRATEPAAPTPPPPRSVRVAVTSMDGTPVPGAFLELVRGPSSERPDEDFRPSRDAPRTEIAAVAGEDGVGTLRDVPPGRWFVFASAPGFARHLLLGTTRDERDAAVETSIALEKGSTFAGTVLDPDGKPAHGFHVILQPVSAWPSDVACLRTMTGKDGAYRFDGVEPGRYVLWYSQWPGPLIEEARVLLPSLDGYDIRMAWGATIDGTVGDAETGAAVPGARVSGIRFEEPRNSASDGETTVFDVGTADSLGRFRLHTGRRQFEVTRLLVDAPGYVPTPVDESGRGPPGAVSDGQRFAFDLRVRRAATLHGKLTSPDGPLAGFLIRVRPEDDDEWRVPWSDMWTATTAANGSFVVDRLPAGPAKVMVLEPATGWFSAEEREVDLAVNDTEEHEFRIDVRRVRVSRRVVDTEDDPVADAEVSQRFGPLRAEARTDAEGRFTMDAIFEADWTFVELRSGRIRTTAIVNVDDEDGATLPVSPIPSKRVVSGTLLRADGSPVAGERLDLVAGSESNHGFDVRWYGLGESFSAVDGTFRIPLTSGPDSYVTVSRFGWLDPEAQDDGSILLTVPDAVRVHGEVVAAEAGEPVAGARLEFLGVVVARTGADGRFALDWLASHGGSPSVVAEGWDPVAVEATSDEQRLELRTRRMSISGAVRRADGSPASGMRVIAFPIQFRMEVDQHPNSATDSDGRFVVHDIDTDAPSWGVIVEDPTEALAGSRATVAPGATGVELALRPAARLVVDVVDSDGQPVSGATVRADTEVDSLAGDGARTPATGRVELSLAVGVLHTIRVERADFGPVEVAGARAGGEPLRIVLKARLHR